MKRTKYSVACSCALLVLLAASVFLPQSGARAATVGNRVNVSRDDAQSILPRVAQDPDGNLHVVWDSGESGRVVRYAKGVWNGSTYAFGGSTVLGSVGNFGYSTPSIAVAPNGTLMAGWSSPDGLRIQTWNSRDNAPSGGAVRLSGGIQSTIAADNQNRFHIAWNGDFNVQYCEWNGSACSKRDAFSENASNRPDITVDSNGGVHVVWDTGQNARYRSRPAGGEWIPIAELGKGNFLQIAGDNQGGVHIVRSADFNIVYCRATLGSACADVKVFDAADDLQPSIGANANGSILVVFRDSGNKSLWYNAIENGAWTASTVLDSGTTPPDVTSRSYTTRFGVAWSLDFDAQVKTVEISGSSRPAGSIVINPKFTGLLGGPGVTNPFDVTVNNAGGQATSVTLRAEGMAERTEPFTGNTVTIRGLQIATNAACERKTISGTLTGPAGTSEEFSTTVWVDRAVDATITTVEELGDPNADNDVIYLRIASGPNECSGLASYRVDFPGTAANPDVTGEIFVTGETVTIPLDGLDQGTHQMNVTLVDKAGLSKTEQFSIVKDSSRPVASARTPLPVTKRGGSFVTLDLSGIQYSDTTSGTPNNQRWGLRVVTQRSDQPVPTDAVLADRGVVVPGTANSLPWNVALGLVGGFTPRQNYTIYVQALDAAGNASGVIASAPVQIDALSGRIFMPIISGPAQ